MDHELGRDWPPIVSIYGAGIAGLTAAHELAVRGFNVVVYEPEEDPRSERDDCQVGGMARTHWARIADSELQRPPRSVGRLRPATPIRERIHFDAGSSRLGKEAAVVDRVASILESHPEITAIYVYGARGPKEREGLDLARAKAVCARLQKRVAKERLIPRGLGHPFGDQRGLRPEAHRVVVFEKVERLIPGEHGYRFFPSFYAHLFDTMKRTPLLEEARASDLLFAKRDAAFRTLGVTAREGVEGRVSTVTSRTAFDNLIPLPRHEIDRADGLAPEPLPRGPTRSLRDLQKMFRALFSDMRFSPRDVGLFESKIIKFATSCAGRRADYENMTWLEFIEIERYSPAFQKAMEQWPQALVAMRASRCDARTFGAVTLQLLLDSVRRSFTDGTLNGPTSEAWLDPWRAYLERAHGVRFVRGALTGLRFNWDERRVEATISSSPLSPLGYFVIALPIERLPEVIDDRLISDLDRWNAEHARGRRGVNTLRAARDFARAAGAARSTGDGDPTPALADFSGIQFFFSGDIHFVDGHTYFPDSEWGLSAIPQAHFRKDPTSWHTTFRGALSVDIGQMHAAGAHGKTAWESTPNQIAAEVLRQVRAGIEGGDRRVPEPIGYHLDDNLVFKKGGGVRENRSRFLINPPGTWSSRPGEPGTYDLMFGCLVLAGTYMKTHTRLTTMEAANESARHAVNAILRGLPEDQRKYVGDLCKTWPLEERELDDLDVFKEIDRGLWERGLPHGIDICGLDALADMLLPSAAWPPRRR